MKKYTIYSNRFLMLKNYVTYVCSLFCVELIFIILSGFTFISWSTLRIFVGVAIFSGFISFTEVYLNKKNKNIFKYIVLFIYTIYAFVQYAFMNYLGIYASVNASSQVGAVTSYLKEFVLSCDITYYSLFIPLLFVVFLNIYKKNNVRVIHKKTTEVSNYIFLKRISSLSVLIILLGSMYVVTLKDDMFKTKNQTIGLLDLFNNASMPTLSVKNFGVLGFLASDVKYYVYGGEETINIYSSDHLSDVVEVDRYFDDTNWLELAGNESNNNYKIIHEYLLNRQSTSYNEYSSIFEDKNIIFVMMESVNDIITYSEYFPNFGTLMDNGLYYENNYSPRNSCPTGNNEFSGITSLYSIYNTCTANDYRNNEYPQSIFNLFADTNYNVISMHDYTEAYYYRKVIHPNLGAHTYYGVDALEMPYDGYNYKNWANDETFAQSAMNILESTVGYDDNFALWLTTVSAHQPYTLTSNESIIYEDYFKELGFTGVINNYLSKLKLTDDLFGVLLDTLEEQGILEDTVIVAYGDHYPYGLGDEIIEDFTGRELDDYEEDKVPFIIYNPSLEKEVIGDYTTFMNITPTIANMFGLDYDPRLYFGKDLFSDEFTSRAVFSDGSWKNEYAYYESSKGIIKYYTDFEYTQEQLEEINTIITNDMIVSSSIIKTNYYEYLYRALLDKSATKEEVESDVGSNTPS